MQNIFLFFFRSNTIYFFFLVKGKIYWKMTKPKHYTIYFFDHSAWKYMFLGFIIGSQVQINFRFQRCFFLWAPLLKQLQLHPKIIVPHTKSYCIRSFVWSSSIKYNTNLIQLTLNPYPIYMRMPTFQHNQTRPIISKAFTENPKDHHIRKITVVFWHSITRDSFTLYVEGKVEYFNHQ